MLKRSILTISPILLGLLTGCATQQTFVPELEDAQSTYAQISQDPIVASLAEADLQSAARHLRRAEEAAASFRKPQSTAHHARLARLQTLTAQQRARKQSASHSVQVALGQNSLLSAEQIAAATVVPEPEPVMAAAISGQAGDIQAQLAALTQQIATLQAQLANGQQQATQMPSAPPAAIAPSASQMADERMLAPIGPQQVIDTPQDTPVATLAPAEVSAAPLEEALTAEPTLGAAMVAPETAPAIELPDNDQLSRKLRAMNAKPNTRGMSLLLGERYFAQGTDRIMQQRAARHLDNVAAVLRQNPGLKLEIEGHTDDQANSEISQDLSVNRAVSIKTALILRGADAEQISTRGFGHTRPIAENSTALGRLQNRRVELVFPLGG
jgi:outer membrane protein OmpA-like peptidoglycan-associated protein